MKIRNIATLALAFSSTLVHANCGPFGVFGDNDYCVRCPSRAPQKVNFCPGGDFGLSAVGVANPGCSVSYYGPGCGDTHALSAAVSSPAPSNAEANGKSNNVLSGRAVVTQKGDEVTIRMKREDFDKLLKAEVK